MVFLPHLQSLRPPSARGAIVPEQPCSTSGFHHRTPVQRSLQQLQPCLQSKPWQPSTSTSARTCVIAQARKRGKKAADEEQEETSAWDSALSHIDAKDDARLEDDDVDEQDYDEQEYDELPGAPEEGDEPQEDPGSRNGYEVEKYEDYLLETLDYQRKLAGQRIPRAEFQRRVAEEERRLQQIAAEEKARQALTAVEPAKVALNRSGYQAFLMDKLEFLVGETADGKLDFHDSYLCFKDMEGYFRPTLQGEIPTEPALFQCIPWTEHGSADSFKYKEEVNRIRKVIFVGVESSAPYRLNLHDVYMFDGDSKVLAKQAVRQVGNNIMDPVLRIRPDGITIEESALLPDPIEVSLGIDKERAAAEAAAAAAATAAAAGASEAEAAAAAAAAAEAASAADSASELSDEERAEKLEELEREMMEEFDELPDAPAVDMM